jgi:hypothetical protein
MITAPTHPTEDVICVVNVNLRRAGDIVTATPPMAAKRQEYFTPPGARDGNKCPFAAKGLQH